MRHLGDITKLNGAEIPVVDVITGGSPCQDLSTAGKRAGLSGERSGLFMEQIRVVKEMRERERNTGRSGWAIRPRCMVWENVPGALSSNHGEDFRIVLEEVARIAQENAVIPRPPRGGWSHSGAIVGDGWSIAWRIHDAQFWGVPQRRKRIALVADFGGGSAPEILFERKGMSGDSEQGEEEGEDSPQGVGGGAEKQSVRILNPSDSQGNQVADSHGVYPALRGCGGAGYQQGYIREPGEEAPDSSGSTAYIIGGVNSEGMKSPNPNVGIYKTDTTRTLDLNGGSPACNQGGGDDRAGR